MLDIDRSDFDDIVNAIEDIGKDNEDVEVDASKHIEGKSCKREQVGDKYVDILYIIVDKFHNSLTYTDIEEAFYKALYKALSTCTDENTFNAYLYKIATNECL